MRIFAEITGTRPDRVICGDYLGHQNDLIRAKRKGIFQFIPKEYQVDSEKKYKR